MNTVNTSQYSFKQIMEKVHGLPPFNPAINRILKVLADPVSNATDVAHAVQLDPVISASVLRLANSAYIGIPRSVSSIVNAVSILGYNRIRSLVLISGIIQGRPSLNDTPFTLYRFWRHSLCCAMLSEAIAEQCKRYEFLDSSEAFAIGLLHDIGKLFAALCAPQYVAHVYERSMIEKRPYFTVESEDGSHTQVGAVVTKSWLFPSVFISAIENHHAPTKSDNHKQMSALVHCADALCHSIGMSTIAGEQAPEMDLNALEILPISVEQLRALASQHLQDQKQVESILQIVS